MSFFLAYHRNREKSILILCVDDLTISFAAHMAMDIVIMEL